ncbi:SRPBCC family protein [Actinoallomurus sp. NPDC052274]|uniref:SRPBCC family protein n=1 Tax=Actinoallomurus sp. NPDC052274 TaxID=3155420 RepID=UPI0034411D16
MIDVTHQINSVRRKVGSRMMEAGEARTVTISQTYAAPIEDVWDACTDPERIPRWFLPVSGDLRLGGRYQLEGNAGGTIEHCDPPKAFTATWEFAGQVSWIEVRLTAESEDGTRFELEHIAHVDDHWDQFGPGAVGVGWDGALLGLAGHLSADPDAITPEQAMAWAGSEEGRRFMTLSSECWCEVNIAAGADETWARAAADRTTAAYTIPPQPADS